MRIGIVGYGCVGKAVAEGFRRKGHATFYNDVKLVRGMVSKAYLIKHCDLIFVCVPTPNLPNGEIKLKHIYDVLCEFDEYPTCPPIIVKSTVVPGSTAQFIKVLPRLKLACNPEFLREKYALQDFLNPDRTIIGSNNPELTKLLLNVYSDFTGAKIVVDPTTAEMIKYIANIFFVVKVAYACEVKRVCDAVGVDAAKVMDAVGYDKRIGRSHFDPRLGPIDTGSPCLPKDLEAFTVFLEQNKIENDFFRLMEKIGVKKECVKDQS